MDAPAHSAPPQVDGLAALLRVTKALATEVHLSRLLEVVAEQATEVLCAERSSLFLYNQEHQELHSMVAQGIPSSSLRLAASTGLAGFVAQTRETINLTDAYADLRFDPKIDARTGFHTRSVLCMPVQNRSGELLGVLQVLNKRDGRAFSKRDEALLEAFCTHAAMALERALLVEAHVEQQRLHETLRLAQEIQMNLLPDPCVLPTEPVDIHAHLAPAETIGGDFYDVFFIDEHRLGFAVGDVSGKGVPAALHMMATHTRLRTYGEQGLAPGPCLERINRAQQGRASMFVTLFYGVLDVRTGLVEYCNAGHHPPCLVRRDGSVRFLPKASTLPLCRVNHLPFRSGHLILEPGDLLLLYTDGITEAATTEGAPFGETRLLDTLRQAPVARAADAVDHLLGALDAFTAGGAQRDDLTVLALRFVGEEMGSV